MQRSEKNKNILLLGISVCILAILFFLSSFFSVLDKSLEDKYISLKSHLSSSVVSPQIIIIDIDDASIESLGTYPFSCQNYTQLIANLREYNPAVIGFDILFLDPSNDPEGDQAFFHELHQEDVWIVLWAAIDGQGEYKIPYSWENHSLDTGFLPVLVDGRNKTVYSFSPQESFLQGEYEHFSLRILRKFYNYMYGSSQEEEMWGYSPYRYHLSSELSAPLAAKNRKEILIHFLPEKSFQHISFQDALDSKKLKKINDSIALQDSIILIGPSSDGLNDYFFTPVGKQYGVYIHANILNTFLTGQFSSYFDAKLEWILIFCITILSVWVNLAKTRFEIFWGNMAIIVIFWLMIPLGILLGTNLVFQYPAEIIASLVFSAAAANIVKYLIEEKNKQRLNSALSEYVGSSIAEEILMQSWRVNLDGEEKDLIVFFSDIEGFTSLAEVLSPQELVSFLRDYLAKMTEIIMQYGGHIDKYEWDAVMALWGAFDSLSESSMESVCEAAILQQKALKEINDIWSTKFGKHLKIRIGIHAGPAILWNIGAQGKKMEFTALWDNVNLASRLEGVNKFYGSSICVSEAVMLWAQEKYFFRYLDKIRVKWKNKSVKIYELVGKMKNVTPDQAKIFENFENAVELYEQRQFRKAYEIFLLLDDIPAKFYMQRCEFYIKNPPEKHWDGVWSMEGK